jgi:copper resistance protein C
VTGAARRLVVFVLVGLGLALGTGTALAHDTLVGADPANGARVDTGPAKVTLSYNLPVQNVSSTLAVVGPDGLHYESGPSTVSGDTVSAPVGALGPAGTYTVAYRIVSDDGHPVSGETTFTLTRPGGGHGVPAAQSPAAATGGAGEPGGSGGGMPVWPWIVGAVILVSAGLGVALRVGR